jgi:type I restriction enzyme R subunit
LFNALVKLTKSLSEEQQRHVRENMSEEEHVVFDILLRPAPELTTEERAEVKKVVRVLLPRLRHRRPAGLLHSYARGMDPFLPL